MQRKHVIAISAVAGIVAAVLLWGAAAFMLCGISGCGGGGFGRSYSPHAVRLLLLLSGVAAAAGPLAAARSRRSRPLLAAAAVIVVSVAVAGGILIGAGVDGYPRSVPRETIEEERG